MSHIKPLLSQLSPVTALLILTSLKARERCWSTGQRKINKWEGKGERSILSYRSQFGVRSTGEPWNEQAHDMKGKFFRAVLRDGLAFHSILQPLAEDSPRKSKIQAPLHCPETELTESLPWGPHRADVGRNFHPLNLTEILCLVNNVLVCPTWPPKDSAQIKRQKVLQASISRPSVWRCS